MTTHRLIAHVFRGLDRLPSDEELVPGTKCVDIPFHLCGSLTPAEHGQDPIILVLERPYKASGIREGGLHRAGFGNTSGLRPFSFERDVCSLQLHVIGFGHSASA